MSCISTCLPWPCMSTSTTWLSRRQAARPMFDAFKHQTCFLHTLRLHGMTAVSFEIEDRAIEDMLSGIGFLDEHCDKFTKWQTLLACSKCRHWSSVRFQVNLHMYMLFASLNMCMLLWFKIVSVSIKFCHPRICICHFPCAPAAANSGSAAFQVDWTVKTMHGSQLGPATLSKHSYKMSSPFLSGKMNGW